MPSVSDPGPANCPTHCAQCIPERSPKSLRLSCGSGIQEPEHRDGKPCNCRLTIRPFRNQYRVDSHAKDNQPAPKEEGDVYLSHVLAKNPSTHITTPPSAPQVTALERRTATCNRISETSSCTECKVLSKRFNSARTCR